MHAAPLPDPSSSSGTEPSQSGLQAQDFDALDLILDDLRLRNDETPQWEFCEGFLAALVCCRRPIDEAEGLAVLLDVGEGGEGAFASPAQREQFLQLWRRRVEEVRQALDTPVDSLDEESAYAPEVSDVRGGVASLPPEEREALGDEALPAFAQVWALGFLYAVEAWPEEWAAPRDREAAKWLDASLQALVTLTEDDADEATLSAFSEDGPPSVSVQRLNDYAQGVWAVYDLRELWRQLGPRVATVRRAATPGRNEPCSCGSGQKFKKCCGA